MTSRLKISVIPNAVLAVLLLAGCGGESKDAAYLSFVRDYDSSLSGRSDGELLGVAHSACDALDAGVPYRVLLATALNNDEFTPSQAGAIIGAAVGKFCPEYAGDL